MFRIWGLMCIKTTVPARMVRGLARTAAAIRGCCKVSRRLPVPAMVTEATLVPAVRPRTKPSTQPVTAILMETGRNIPAVSTGAKPIAGTAAIRITNTPAIA